MAAGSRGWWRPALGAGLLGREGGCSGGRAPLGGTRNARAGVGGRARRPRCRMGATATAAAMMAAWCCTRAAAVAARRGMGDAVRRRANNKMSQAGGRASGQGRQGRR